MYLLKRQVVGVLAFRTMLNDDNDAELLATKATISVLVAVIAMSFECRSGSTVLLLRDNFIGPFL